MSTITINLDLADDMIKEYQSHKETYNKKFKKLLSSSSTRKHRSAVPDFIIPSSNLTAKELAEEEGEIEARRSEIERRLKDKSGSTDAMELLKRLDNELNN